MSPGRLGVVDNLRLCFCGSWDNCIVPISVEGVGENIEFGHFGVGDFDPCRIEIFIEFTADGQACRRCGRADEFDDSAIVDERSSSPVARDEREEAVFDLVPLCALPRCTDVVGANPTRQLSLQPEAPGADQEATNGLKHFGKRSLLGISGPYGPQQKRTSLRPRKDQT